jgi:hypothetical protein
MKFLNRLAVGNELALDPSGMSGYGAQ